MVNKENADVRLWLAVLSEATKGGHHPALWLKVSREVSAPTRYRPEVDLGKLDRLTKEGENIVVPGKVLSGGRLGHKISIAAVGFSEAARSSLLSSGCSILSINEMVGAEQVRVII